MAGKAPVKDDRDELAARVGALFIQGGRGSWHRRNPSAPCSLDFLRPYVHQDTQGQPVTSRSNCGQPVQEPKAPGTASGHHPQHSGLPKISAQFSLWEKPASSVASRNSSAQWGTACLSPSGPPFSSGHAQTTGFSTVGPMSGQVMYPLREKWIGQAAAAEPRRSAPELVAPPTTVRKRVQFSEGPQHLQSSRDEQLPHAPCLVDRASHEKIGATVPPMGNWCPQVSPPREEARTDFVSAETDDSSSDESGSEERKGSQGRSPIPRRNSERSQSAKARYKVVYKELKDIQKTGDFIATVNHGFSSLNGLPKKYHHRVVLELADFAKRENKTKEARDFYRIVSNLQPNAIQGWLEFAKLEEECGDLESCTKILERGLEHCPDHEALVVKLLKHYERMEMADSARRLLGRLKDEPLERCWRIIMEGGLFEARQGNVVVARMVFHFLTDHVPWYGPTYQEACRFEEKCEQDALALKFVERGLDANSRYGPLWFSALRLHEKIARAAAAATGRSDLSAVHAAVKKATRSISKELQWKIFFEAAQIEDRAGHLGDSRKFYVLAVSHCPQPLLWKVWMRGAKTELNHGNIDIARLLLQRALQEVPIKMRAMVLLDYSRLEEFAGRPDRARKILREAKRNARQEWKVFLESILLEMRFNDLPAALEEAKEALDVHSGTGRLWAIMIQLSQDLGVSEQMRVFKAALREVPKSGEVWCEGARIAMRHGKWAKARTFIQFAIQFTPQYGDSFIEFIRLELLEKGPLASIGAVEQACVNADPNYGTLWLHCKQHPLDSTRQVLRVALAALLDESSGPMIDRLHVSRIYEGVQSRPDHDKLKAIFL